MGYNHQIAFNQDVSFIDWAALEPSKTSVNEVDDIHILCSLGPVMQQIQAHILERFTRANRQTEPWGLIFGNWELQRHRLLRWLDCIGASAFPKAQPLDLEHASQLPEDILTACLFYELRARTWAQFAALTTQEPVLKDIFEAQALNCGRHIEGLFGMLRQEIRMDHGALSRALRLARLLLKTSEAISTLPALLLFGPMSPMDPGAQVTKMKAFSCGRHIRESAKRSSFGVLSTLVGVRIESSANLDVMVRLLTKGHRRARS